MQEKDAMNFRQLHWRINYSLHSPYFRPYRFLAAKAGYCMIPNFLILGTQRGGTTSLWVYLLQSSKVRGALRKEVDYFDYYYSKGLTWYFAHFPLRTSQELLTGEATPNYLFYPEVVDRVAKALPNIKLIVMLRNPIDRAYSHYHHEVANDFEHVTSFEQAITRECVLGSDGSISGLRNLREGKRYDFEHFSYLSRGLYVEQLKRWMNRMPRNQFLIIKSELFYDDPAKVFSEVLNFLGLPQVTNPTFRKPAGGQYNRMKEETRSRLRQFYAPYNNQLSQLLNMDFEEWSL